MPAARPPVRIAGRYELNELLAAGGFGEVWQAADLSLGRPVAVKILHASFAGHPETMARFRAEARHSGSLAHENVARVYDYGEPPEADAPYLVMELVPGPSLAGMLAAGPLDAARVSDIVAQAAAGLDAAHRAGLVHRDIKPGNLLIRPDGQVKITDFGISYAAGAAPVTGTGQLVGTPGYLAPERVRGGRAGPASDLYSLGVVAWECLTGTVPFEGAPVEVAIAHRDRPLPPLPASVPAELAALIGDLTAKDPALRPPTAGAVASRAAELRDRRGASPLPPAPALATGSRAVAGHTIEMAGPAAGRRPPAARRRRPGRAGPFWAAAAAAAVVAAAAGLTLAGLLGPRTPHSSALAAGAATPSAAAAAIEVSGKSLIGQPVSAVVTRLGKLGLKVAVRWELSDQQPAGDVVSVQPAGRLAPGSLVTVTGALAAPASQAPGYARPAATPSALAPAPVPSSSWPAASAPPVSAPSPAPSGSGPSSPAPTGSPAPTASPAPSGSPTAGPAPTPSVTPTVSASILALG